MKASFVLIVAALAAAPIAAKTPNSKSETLIEVRWERINYLPPVGKVDVRRDGLFIVDKRPLNPVRALETCRAYGAGSASSKAVGNGSACEIFLYPSARKLAGAEEAVAIYELQFAKARSAAERISIAIDLNLGVDGN